MVQRRAARFVKGRYGMYESVTQMLEELTWVPLSKRRENACLIGYNVDPYGQSFFPKCISVWNGLAQEIAEANTLDLFKSKLAH